MNAWLIEVGENPVLYWANDGDWCSNPNHAHKFESADAANAKAQTMAMVSDRALVCEHQWD